MCSMRWCGGRASSCSSTSAPPRSRRSRAAPWTRLRPLIARTAALINGTAAETADRQGPQAAVDAIFEPVNTAPDARAYPDRPFLAVSAAIIRDGRVLVARRARGPALGIWTMPGGVVEAGETLIEALVREIAEETAMIVEPVALAGHREVVVRDDDQRVSRHFVIMCFATRWISGEPQLNEELAEARWLKPEELAGLKTTEGLAEIVAAAFERMAAAG